MMDRCRKSGFSLLEVLISAAIFTMVVLGISQSVSLMYRYSRANLCKLKAHLMAVSCMESILYGTHPYQTMGSSFTIRSIMSPTYTYTFNPNSTNLNSCSTPIYNGDSNMLMYMHLKITQTPLYEKTETDRKKINPPEGFQAVLLLYAFDSPLIDSPFTNNVKGMWGELTSNSLFDSLNLPDNTMNLIKQRAHNVLYAIRPIQPDDP